ncbi:amino acid ABC transporter ATP-binding protein [Clostridium sp. DL1XJH146]
MKLSIRNLTKSFNGNVVLNNLNLEIEDKHSLVIIGPSGGGKSTLLRIIAGLEMPDSGEIYLNNKRIEFNENYLREYRKTLGVVFQSYNLFPHFSAIENITLPLIQVHKKNKEEANEIAVRLLKRFQLDEHAYKKPVQLSGGQQQRVAIVRALAISPECLLFDEPTSALDPELTSEVLDTIISLKEDKRDLMVVTHEMGFARKASDYAVFVSGGKIAEQGEKTEIFDSPKSDELKKFFNKVLNVEE